MKSLLWCVSLATVTAAPQAEAQSLREFARAVASAPSLAAQSADADAAAERAAAAGVFPDPSVEMMLERKRTMEERMPMWSVTLSQPLPRFGERRAGRARASASAAMARASFSMMAAEETRSLALMMIEGESARQRGAVIEAQAERMRAVLGVTETRITTGRATVSERLALENQLDAMTLMVAQEEQMARTAEAQAKAMLGLPSAAPLPILALPTVGDLQSEEMARSVMAQAQIEEARAMRAMARASVRPMTGVALRFERERERMGNNDTVGVAFMTDLPWQSRRIAQAELKASRRVEEGASATAAYLPRLIDAASARVMETERVAEEAATLSQRSIKRLDAQYEVILREASGPMGGESSVLMLLELADKSTEVELRRIEAETNLAKARAELWVYMPASLFSSETLSPNKP